MEKRVAIFVSLLALAQAFGPAYGQRWAGQHRLANHTLPDAQGGAPLRSSDEQAACPTGIPDGFVLVRGGGFRMGSEDGDDRDKPAHRVGVSDFLMGQHEVTQRLWQEVMGGNPSWFQASNGQEDCLDCPDCPVEMVSWYEAVAFCNALSEREGLRPCYNIDKNLKDPNNRNSGDSLRWTVTCDWTANGYRLPTEAEWEYAAGGGSRRRTNWAGTDSEEELVKYAWYGANAGRKTHPVGLLSPNRLGLYDMGGNVWEWCWDWYDYYASRPKENPRGANISAFRVLRGDSWYNANLGRVANRINSGPDSRSSDFGFRLVRSAPSSLADHTLPDAQGGAPLRATKRGLARDGAREGSRVAADGAAGEQAASPTGIPDGFVLVGGGSFQMGSEDGYDSESPVHSVTVSDFLMGKHEVTQRLWLEVMGGNPSFFQASNGLKDCPDCPVEMVSWYDAVEFCNALSEREGLRPCYNIDKTIKDPNNWNRHDSLRWVVTCDWTANGYRLPTEAEWEYAAGGGSSGRTKWAGTDSKGRMGRYVWYDANTTWEPHAVGQLSPNRLGLYDMAGNVWETCWDWDDDYEPGSQTDPRGANGGWLRVSRGGSWHSSATQTLVSVRCGGTPASRNNSFGFRLVRSAPSR